MVLYFCIVFFPSRSTFHFAEGSLNEVTTHPTLIGKITCRIVNMPRKLDVINIDGKYGDVFDSGGGIQGERDVRQRPLSASVVEATQNFTAVVWIE